MFEMVNLQARLGMTQGLKRDDSGLMNHRENSSKQVLTTLFLFNEAFESIGMVNVTAKVPNGIWRLLSHSPQSFASSYLGKSHPEPKTLG
jgi:hypothetical protein